MKTALLQLQDDVAGRLSVELSAWNINVKEQRKLLVEAEYDILNLVLEAVNGVAGAGVMVEMPVVEVQQPNLPGPVSEIAIAATVLESPEINNSPNSGTCRSAEEIAVRVLQVLHLFYVASLGTLYARGTGIEPTADFEGLVGYRVHLRLRMPSDVLAVTPNPILSAVGLTVTLANGAGAAAAEIYYTVDGESFPGKNQANAFLYSTPFAVADGTVVRYAAYLSGSIGSGIQQSTITS